MVFFEAIMEILQLNLQFFTDLVTSQMLWVFGFAVLIYFFFDKNRLYWYVLWAFLLWAILDWEHLTGMAFSGASFLLFYYVTKLSILAIAEKSPALKKYMIVISTLHAYTLIVIFTFLVGSGV